MTAGGGQPSAERRELDTFLESFTAAWNRHDAAGMAAHWEPEGDLLNTRGHHAQGRAAVEQLLGSEFSGPMRESRATLALTDVRVLAPGLVHADARQTVEGVRSADGRTLPPLSMHVAFVARRGAEGWRYLAVRPYALLSGF